MEVIAVLKGFDNLAVREPGDVFEMPAGSQGAWFVRSTSDDQEAVKLEGDGISKRGRKKRDGIPDQEAVEPE